MIKIEKNNCFIVYARSDLNKIREETIKKSISLIGQSTRKFKNRMNTSLSLRRPQRNGLNGTVKSLNCVLT